MKRTLALASLLTGLCIGLSIVCLAVSGCSSVGNLHIINPTYSIRDVRPTVSLALPLQASSIDFDLLVAVDNPNSVELRLDRMDFNLLVNDRPVVDGFTDQRISIPARGVGDVSIRARVGYDSLRSIFQDVAAQVQGGRARYELRGTAYYNTPVGQLRFPLTVYRSGSR